MKKNKKKIYLVLFIAVILALVLGSIYYFIDYNKKNSLTLNESKWLDSNKYNVIDVSILNDVPILSYDGSGIVYDYLDYVSSKYSLEFNVISSKTDSNSSYEYKLNILKKPNNNDIVLLKDDLILVTTSGIQYNDLTSINNLKIGILSEDKEDASNYLKNNLVEFVEYVNYSELKNIFSNSKANLSQGLPGDIDAIIIPKTLFIKEIIENDYTISFELNNLKRYFVLTLGNTKELNGILNKAYTIWSKKNYKESYNQSLLQNYYAFSDISDIDQKTLQSKNYTYGFTNYGIYNYLKRNEISGLSGIILKEFNKFSGISIKYTRYNSVNRLLKDFNSNKIDFILNTSNDDDYSIDIYNTIGVFNKNLAIISGINNIDVINNIPSLVGKEVSVVKDTYLEKYLLDNEIKVKSYNNLSELVHDFKLTDIAFVDLENYNYYKSSSFKNAKINFLINMNEKYDFVINNKVENKTFEKLFNFYVNFVSIDELENLNYNKIAYENIDITYILAIVLVILLIYVILDFYNHIKFMIKRTKKNKKVHLSKEDKIKYIDSLTSLKNRAYLNSRVESWDDSEIYPQAIIIIDLNNISYINDSFGREEGDKVITEAANILIMHQLHNSEIIRTDGNEFLIYLIEYNEKQIISYLRKLNKEFKNLSHGFGAASGYSIINDAIKTVDDAVNEATLAMKENKEDIDY